VKTAYHTVRQSAKDSVPVEFEISRARQELQDLTPAIETCTEEVARAEVRVERMEQEIVAERTQLDREGRKLVALRQHLDEARPVPVTGLTYSRAEILKDLGHRLDCYKDGRKILAEKDETLRLRKQAVQSAREKLENMKAARQVLLTKIEGIEAKLRQIEASQAASAISFDDSALARVKQTVAELEQRVEVKDRVNAQKASLSERALAVELDQGRDVAREIDAEFGAPAEETRTPQEKDL
jgi:chromosome segregation ATPase